ncbi:MAG: hypothetical protein V8Q78_02790 [Blautia sp.]
MNKKQQRQQKMLRQQEIVNAAKEAGRDLTAEEQTEFDSLQREIERLNGEIEAEEQQQRGMNPSAKRSSAESGKSGSRHPESNPGRKSQNPLHHRTLRRVRNGSQKLYRERCDT